MKYNISCGKYKNYRNRYKKLFKKNFKNLTAVGFEPTPVYTDQNSHYSNVSYLKLESGALDRSAILSYGNHSF